MTNLTPIHSLLSSHPRLSRASLSPVHQWLADGADMDLDIVPVIKHWLKLKPDIYSLGFFTPYVRESRDARRRKTVLTPRQRAERIAFRRKVGQKHPTDERWLAGYEAIHGAVIV